MFSLVQLGMEIGSKTLFKDVNLQLKGRSCYGLVGANGSGKTTFLKILSREIKPSHGGAHLPSGTEVGVLKQDLFPYEELRIVDVVMMGNESLWKIFEKQERLLGKKDLSFEEIEELSQCNTELEAHGGYQAESEAARILEGLGIDSKRLYEPLKNLSGGNKIRVLLAQLLFKQPDILLLDEPTNYLDLFSIKWLEGFLVTFPGTCIVCSHDRYFLNTICNHILDVDYQTIKVYTGNYDLFWQDKLEQLALKEQNIVHLEKKQKDMQGFIDRFRYKATKARQAQSRMRLVDKLEKEKEKFEILPSSRSFPFLSFAYSGKSDPCPLKIEELAKSFSQNQLFKELSLEIERGQKIAIVGPNGVGKSTLLEILVGNLLPDEGLVKWGGKTQFGYFPQHFESQLSGHISVGDWLDQLQLPLKDLQLREGLGRHLFSGDDVHKIVRFLSGGEKARLMLCKLSLQPHNLIFLDEPTNHLDLEACESLIEAVANFEGTVIMVSHNRHFISETANRILELSPEGLYDFIGTYAEYIAMRNRDYLDVKKMSKGKKESKESNREELQQLKKQTKQLEAAIQKLEVELETKKEYLATEGFYLKTPLEERQAYLREVALLEEKLTRTYQDWEQAIANLEN